MPVEYDYPKFDVTGKDTLPEDPDPHGYWKKYMVLLSPVFAAAAMLGVIAVKDPDAAMGILREIAGFPTNAAQALSQAPKQP